MNLTKIKFPIYKLRAYLSIDTTLMGVTKITTVKGEFVLDDDKLDGDFLQRRVLLSNHYPRTTIYKLNEKVSFLRQLVKYKSGTSFVDTHGKIFKYRKGSKLFKVESFKIIRVREHGIWTIIYVDTTEQPYIVGHALLSTTTHASIMFTDLGPFLYDLTTEKHKMYRRKI